MKSFYKVLTSVAIAAFFNSCYYDNYSELHPLAGVNACDTTVTMSFSTHIAPILSSSCGSSNSCHGSSNTSGVDLSAFAGVNAVALDGRLVSSIIWDGNASQMPQGSSAKISICDQTKIKKWVLAGALNN